MNNDSLSQQAINAALRGDWKEAVKINLEIISKNNKDIDALNRLARAYAELGDLPKARSTCKAVLKIDPFNSIATRQIEKWKELKKGETYKSPPSNVQLFLEEPGKTKICSLFHLGNYKVIARLDSGDEVKIDMRPHKANIVTSDGKYIGRLPDNLYARLKELMKYGNKYAVYIKSVEKNDVKVFIRETKRSDKVSDIPSFPAEKIDYISFTPPELIHDKPDLSNIQDDEESE